MKFFPLAQLIWLWRVRNLREPLEIIRRRKIKTTQVNCVIWFCEVQCTLRRVVVSPQVGKISTKKKKNFKTFPHSTQREPSSFCSLFFLKYWISCLLEAAAFECLKSSAHRELLSCGTRFVETKCFWTWTRPSQWALQLNQKWWVLIVRD